MWALTWLVSAAGIVVLSCAAVFCAACGLYAAADWLDEHPRSTARLVRRSTQACATLQALWMLTDTRLAPANLVGLASHAVSWRLLARHEARRLALEQPLALASVALLVLHQVAWTYLWVAESVGPVWQLACVLALCVWPAPTLLLLVAAGGCEADLPLTAAPPPQQPLARLDSSGSSSGSPLAAATGAVKLRARHALHQHTASDPPLLPTDAGPSGQRDQGLGPRLAKALRPLPRQQQDGQQPQQPRRRSQALLAMERARALLGWRSTAVLPVAQQYEGDRPPSAGAPGSPSKHRSCG